MTTDLQKQRRQLIQTINQKGGAANAPKAKAKLVEVTKQIKADRVANPARNPVNPQPGNPGTGAAPGGPQPGASNGRPPKVRNPVGKNGKVKVSQGTNAAGRLEDYATDRNFDMNNPNFTDSSGNSREVITMPDGTVHVNESSGIAGQTAGNAFIDAAQGNAPISLDEEIQNFKSGPSFDQRMGGGNATDWAGRAADANYNYRTKNYARDKQREMEAAKQELAERGIPIDAASGSLWSKTLGSIDDKYRDLDDQAMNQAITQSNETLNTLTGTTQAADDSGLAHFGAGVNARLGQGATNAQIQNSATGAYNASKPNFQPYAGGNYNSQAGTFVQFANMSVDQIMTKYGIDKQAATALAQIAAQKDIAAANRSFAGGGGGGDTGASINNSNPP